MTAQTVENDIRIQEQKPRCEKHSFSSHLTLAVSKTQGPHLSLPKCENVLCSLFVRYLWSIESLLWICL